VTSSVCALGGARPLSRGAPTALLFGDVERTKRNLPGTWDKRCAAERSDAPSLRSRSGGAIMPATIGRHPTNGADRRIRRNEEGTMEAVIGIVLIVISAIEIVGVIRLVSANQPR
jgi:hypothetical protein